jgi:diacylglycerol kinase family enzyme
LNVTLVLNPNAGRLRGLDPEKAAETVAAIFRAHGHDVKTEICAGPDAVTAIARICREGACDAIVVGGGDGTVSAAAAAAAESGIALGVLPLGTMNLFARSLGMPLEMLAAAEAIAGGTMRAVDIGEVNGRLFTHAVGLGLHPRMIRLRGRLQYGSWMGKILASIQAWWTAVRRPPRIEVEIRVDGRSFERRTSAILISNNPLGEGHLPYADDLQQRKLGLYVATSRRWQDLVRLAARMTLGEIAANPFIESYLAEEIEIHFERSTVNASMDGEIVSFETPLRLKVRRGGLTVLVPSRAEPRFRGSVDLAKQARSRPP